MEFTVYLETNNNFKADEVVKIIEQVIKDGLKKVMVGKLHSDKLIVVESKIQIVTELLTNGITVERTDF